ncbi:hypothetical protein P9B42_01115 [Bacillus safensis]|uniref:hypothetical protein n=1 Tax=Bacillus safensis TaxID=561879 RepID=UPI002DBF3688|nr:hypothetical protein [Bacillus safensis]MEC0923966.1 hypothetical protein [Bacillus safensis]MEC0996935.1 hypothetical protein [Bacillus safensis]MEC0997271.1 hypothetical protein [Bacillus safensis]
MKVFRVVFVFDREHRKIILVPAENKEELYKKITSDSGWFEHYDKDKKVHSLIQLDLVRSVNIKIEK